MFLNALVPIVVSDAGVLNELITVPSNAFAPIVVTLVPKLRVAIDEHELNALSPIVSALDATFVKSKLVKLEFEHP